MRKIIAYLILLLLVIVDIAATKSSLRSISDIGITSTVLNLERISFHETGLEGKLDFHIYARALQGLKKLSFKNQKVLTIIDFTKASTEKRFFVIDLEHHSILYESLVAHGKNSGIQFADTFSNNLHSLQSSPGFYKTAETYQGKHGYSLRLDGLEVGINDHARERAIVIHGADYVSEQFIHHEGRIGRSWGCPVLPEELSRKIIDVIKNGSCLYIHTDNSSYLNNSVV